VPEPSDTPPGPGHAYLTPGADEHLQKKQVPAHVYRRLELAADAIAETKRAIAFQGNQIPALKATRMNSQARLRVMRDPACWEMTPEARRLASENPEAAVAAKADLAHGGNCGENAWVAYHWLRANAKGETIQRASKTGLDHAFVLVGPLGVGPDREVVCSDPWVNRPMACLWEDHFAYTSDHAAIEGGGTSAVADGLSFKEAIKAGLKLSARGLDMVDDKKSRIATWWQTEMKSKENHFWNHDDARADGHQFDYQPDAAP
jgi:hypothetical protein